MTESPTAPRPTVGSGFVRRWLAQKVRQERGLSLLAAAALVPAGLLVLWLTVWVIYGIIWFGFSPWLTLTRSGVMLATSAVVLVIFVSEAIIDRAYHEELKFDAERPGWGGGLLGVVFVGTFGGWPMRPVGPQTVHSFVKLLVTALLLGPRLLAAAWKLVQRAQRLRTLDVAGCSRVLAMLLAAEGRVPLRALVEAHPDLDAQQILPQLREMGGVVYLPSPPEGLTLAPTLADEILESRRRSRARGNDECLSQPE